MITQGAQLDQVLRRVKAHPAGALYHRFHDDRGDIGGIVQCDQTQQLVSQLGALLRQAARERIAGKLGVRKMVALGSYPFGSPHTRAPRLSCSSPSAEVISNVGYLKNSVDVPAGMSAVLEHSLAEAGIAALGIWVQVPHYVSAMSYPAASAALLEGVREVTGIAVETPELAREAEIQRQRIDQLVGGNDDHQTMVRQLEAAYDQAIEATAEMDRAISDLPSGDELAAEFERFLRDQSE